METKKERDWKEKEEIPLLIKKKNFFKFIFCSLKYEEIAPVEEVDEPQVLEVGEDPVEEVVEEVPEEVVEEEVPEEVVEEVVEEEPVVEVTKKVEQTKIEEPKGAVLHSKKRTGAVKGRSVGVAKWSNPKEVEELIAKVLHPGSFSGWILCGYQDDNCTLEIHAHGEGGVNQFVPLLEDDQWQYILVRIQDTSKNIKMGGETKKTTRDVFITWQGPSVSILQRGKFNEHRNTIRSVMKPSHADLIATGKKNFTEQEVQNKSAPLSGSHEIS